MNYDVIIILGGGRYNDGSLTELSKQRLLKGYEVYGKKANKILTLGSKYSTYSPKAIEFNETGAEIRKQYLIELGVSKDAILKVELGRDTICEAFASREKIKEEGFKKCLLVTSDKHMPRALWIFSRIYGDEIIIDGEMVECGDILIPEEEIEYFKVTKEFFEKFPQYIDFPNLNTWFQDHKELYESFKNIHDKFHPLGKESQAYAGVKK